VDASIETLGVDDQGVMQAPTEGDVVGWYDSSARPGWPGNTVMAGHLDWRKRPAVFFRLRELQPGDQIEVEAADGTSYVYLVAESESFHVDNAPLFRLVGPTA